MAMNNVEVKFIDWDKSALEKVGEELLKMAGTEEFRRATVVVPTAESGRRLKEWMAAQAGRPLLMPRMALAGQLIQAPGENVANETETLAAWLHVLTAKSADEGWMEFFPPPQQKTQVQDWALRTAERLMQLQLQMEQYEVSIPGLLHRMAGREGVDNDLAERWDALRHHEENHWHALKHLIDEVDKTLRARGKTPAWEARRQWLANVGNTPNAPMIIVACLPELSPQVRRYLRSYPGKVRIRVHAPEKESKNFDEFGCVVTQAWAERALPELANEEVLQVEPSAQGLAKAALACVSQAEEATLACCDASFTPAIVTEFAKHGWCVHVPEGRSYRVSDLANLPTALAAACSAERPTWAAIEPLLRNTAAQRLAAGSHFDSYRFNKLLDKICERFLPDSMHTLLQQMNPAHHLPGNPMEVKEILRLRREEFYQTVLWLDSFIHSCRQDVCRGLCTLSARLRHIYAGDILDHAARQMAKQAKALADYLQTRPQKPEVAWALICHSLSKYEEMLQDNPREQAHVDALGWRELAFAKGDTLVLTGLHEDCVPEPLPADPFLPDSLRETLGMPCNRSREARDCYLLSALLSRRGVEVRIILSRSAADGTGSPVEPSALLYHCDIKTLVGRVQRLLRELPVEKAADHYRDDWSLAPQELHEAEGDMESVHEQLDPHWQNPFAQEEYRFSPSQINKFLTCPLRFWMKTVLKLDPMETYKEDKAEMEAAEYGSLIHAALEDIGKRFGSMETLLPVDDMYAAAEETLRQHAHEHYGRETLPILVEQQIRSFCSKSLRPFLEWHHGEISKGWVCHACEHKVEDWPLPLPDGQVAHITMRVDRIDHHPVMGKWRIIDYKTHERTPKNDHLELVKQTALWNEKMGAENFPLFNSWHGKSKQLIHPHRWKDVQLPMYACWLAEKEQCELPEVAYFNLPRSRAHDSKYTPMTELTEAALASAITWTKSAIALMRAGKCLYSAETFGCKAFGTYSENEELADPRSLFHTLKPVTLSSHEPSNE